jgi:eukaryotic-like serine/threonine-protein kinase
MMHPPDADPQIGRVLAGQFRIEELLGRGGMGNVYRGVQLSVDRPVAIKLISGDAPNQEELLQRFRREAEATARLSHPNTVRLFDFGVSEQRELYMVMELLSGSDLAAHLTQHGKLPLPGALLIARQVLQALSEAHALGIVHRDLKPGNIYLSRVQGGEMFAKVMDFGIAGIEAARDTHKLTLTGTVVGTPAYMSPEQAQGKPVDGRSDLYSLGVMLFEMLTGRLPFEAETMVSLLLAHVTQPPPRLRDLQPDLPKLNGVQRLLDHLLAKEPEQRPPSAGAALELIDALSSGAGVPESLRVSGASLSTGAITPARGAPTPLGWTVGGRAPKRASAWLRYAALGGATLLLTAAGGVLWRAQPGARPTGRVEALPTPDPTKGLSSVTIASAPSGASVQLDGVELGKTPFTLQVRRPTRLTLVLSGYVPQTLELTEDSDPNIAIDLLERPAAVSGEPDGSAEAVRAEPPFISIAAVQRAYRAGSIDADAYEGAVSLLKARRDERIQSEKENLKRGEITPEEYAQRLERIDAEMRGE